MTIARQHSNEEKRDTTIRAVWAAIARYGIDGTTIDCVASLAGFSKGVIHYYFDSKKALLLAAFAAFLESFDSEIFGILGSLGREPDASEALEAVIRSTLPSFSPEDGLAAELPIPNAGEILSPHYKARLFVQFFILAMGDRDFAAVVARSYERQGRAVAKCLELSSRKRRRKPFSPTLRLSWRSLTDSPSTASSAMRQPGSVNTPNYARVRRDLGAWDVDSCREFYVKTARFHVFSGTGNSLYLARVIAERLGDDFRIEIAEVEAQGRGAGGSQPRTPIVRNAEDLDLFLFPVYALSVPRIMARYIARLGMAGPLTDKSRPCAAILATNGRISRNFRDGHEGRSLAQAERILSRRGWEVVHRDTFDFPQSITISSPPRTRRDERPSSRSLSRASKAPRAHWPRAASRNAVAAGQSTSSAGPLAGCTESSDDDAWRCFSCRMNDATAAASARSAAPQGLFT